MIKINDFTFNKSEQEKPDDFRQGVTKLTEQLFVGGEDDICSALNQIDLWIDFRDPTPWNRRIYIPENVVYV